MMNPFESTDEPDRHIRKIWEIFFEQGAPICTKPWKR